MVSPNLIQVAGLTVRWYSVFIVFGGFLGWRIVLGLRKYYSFSPEFLSDILLGVLVWGLVGARLYHVLINWSYYGGQLVEIPQIWLGGLAIHGAWFGGGGYLMFKVKKLGGLFFRQVLSLTDLLAVGLIFGQAIGRIGNYFNQELYGLPTDLPWKIYISPQNRLAQYQQFSYFQPVFLYEVILNASLGYFLVRLTVSNHQKLQVGAVASLYLGGYSLIRFLLEFVRVDPSVVFWGLRWPQIFSLGIIFSLLFIWSGWWFKKTKLSS